MSMALNGARYVPKFNMHAQLVSTTIHLYLFCSEIVCMQVSNDHLQVNALYLIKLKCPSYLKNCFSQCVSSSCSFTVNV